MKLDGAAVQYMLAQEFGDVVGDHIPRSAFYDFPSLYDETSDMTGMVVLLPEFERPHGGLKLDNALCICLGAESAQSAWDAGIAAIHVRAKVTFQRLYNYMQRLYVHNEQIDAQMKAYVMTCAGFQPLLDVCADAFGYSCTLIDEQYRLVCQAQPGGRKLEDGVWLDVTNGEMLESELVDLFMASRSYRYMRSSRNVTALPGSYDLMIKNVFSRNRLVGTLAVKQQGDVQSARFVRYLLNYLGSYVEKMYASMGSFGLSTLESDRVRTLIENALSGVRGGYDVLQDALEEYGCDPQSAYAIVRIERSFTNEGVDEQNYLFRRFKQAWPQGYCFSQNGKMYLLANVGKSSGETQDDFLRMLPEVARDNLAKVGVSRAFNDMQDLEVAMLQASIALERGSEVEPTNWCYRFEKLALSWLIDRVAAGMPIEAVCHQAVPTLMRHDDEHGTQYLVTLKSFIMCRYSATAAAKELFIARSTLLSRLERIVELTHLNLDDFEERIHLGVSFALLNDTGVLPY